MEALAKIRISGEARQVLDVVFRKTYGFQKKEDAISISQFCIATGLHRNSVCKAVAKLIEMNLITKKGYSIANIYRFNKDFDTWRAIPKKVTTPPKSDYPIPKKVNKRTPKSDPQKIKDTITKDIAEPSSAEIPLVIDAFKEVNPSYRLLFARPPQRKACERMLKTYGLENLLSRIAFLPKTNSTQYAPTITTPIALENKMGDLEAFVKKSKNKADIISERYVL